MGVSYWERAMSRKYRAYDPSQVLMLPANPREWLPEGHLALFVSDTVDELDLSAIHAEYAGVDGRGQPPHHPALMVKLLVYGYCTGRSSSRMLERATWEDVAFRVLCAGTHPDHDCIADFRRRNLKSLAGLFAQVLSLAWKLGLVKMGQVALDGTKILANASKHKAMSHGRMLETEARLQAEVEALAAALLASGERSDESEDARLGKGRVELDLPAELKRREDRLRKIRAAKSALEREARERAAREAAEGKQRLAERERKEAEVGHALPGARPKVPSAAEVAAAAPDPKAQRNFTDPESRIMMDGASKGFVQAYNAQIAVDGASQIIVAAAVTQDANDKRQLVPMMAQVRERMGMLPTTTLADSGYFSEAAVSDPALSATELLVPPGRQRHGDAASSPVAAAVGTLVTGLPAATAVATTMIAATVADAMRTKLKSEAGRAAYARRKTIVEPVFGQGKGVLGFRRFSMRGVAAASGEWDLLCAALNLRKIHASGRAPGFGPAPPGPWGSRLPKPTPPTGMHALRARRLAPRPAVRPMPELSLNSGNIETSLECRGTARPHARHPRPALTAPRRAPPRSTPFHPPSPRRRSRLRAVHSPTDS